VAKKNRIRQSGQNRPYALRRFCRILSIGHLRGKLKFTLVRSKEKGAGLLGRGFQEADVVFADKFRRGGKFPFQTLLGNCESKFPPPGPPTFCSGLVVEKKARR